ncbi:MAG: signal recognition particle-docking protein FtsY [Lactobacillaceae bacterium]|jgi:fused signal recognition particle receptor|nr:signal recognition particle-docking protein FtsY [Lactobacillaceae bacterium]
MGLFDSLKKRKHEDQTDADVEEIVETPKKEGLFSRVKKALDVDLGNEEDYQVEKPAEKSPVTYEKGLEQSRNNFSGQVNKLLANFRNVDESFFEDLEDTLISADVGFEMAMKISDELRDEARFQNIRSKQDAKNMILQKLVEVYEASGDDAEIEMHFAPSGTPSIFMFVGVNGVGKTTTIGKLAMRYKNEGKKVLLAAADTFRAGATQQLQEWADRDGVDIVTGKEKADPASVVFEAVKKAVEDDYDVLLVDTAGRLQNNQNLMKELEKMKNVIKREIPDAPNEVLLVLDSTTGQNAVNQAKLFKDSSDVTGIVLTKLDGTAKGGIVMAIREELNLPVKFVGLGEGVDDLQVFDSNEFVYGLFKDLIEA